MNKLIEGVVDDLKKEHFKISYKSFHDKDRNGPNIPEVALLERDADGNFVYQFVIEKNESNKDIIDNVLRQFNFYLIEHGPKSFAKDGWEYAKYHTSTSSNLYSPVHWAYFPSNFIENQKRLKKILVEIAEPELLKLYPDFHQNGLELVLESINVENRGNQSVWLVRYGAKEPGTEYFLSYTGVEICVDLSMKKILSVKERKEYEESDKASNQRRNSE